MATIKHEENIVRIPVKVVSYQQDEKTASMIVKEKFGFSENRISFDRQHNVDLQALLKRSRYLKRIKSKVEVEKLYGYLIGVVIDDKLICRSIPEAYPQDLKKHIAELEEKYQKLQEELQKFAQSFPADFDVRTECYNIQNMWLRIWVRALAEKGLLTFPALQIKVIEAADKAYAAKMIIHSFYSSTDWLFEYICASEQKRDNLPCDFSAPDSLFKDYLKQSGVQTDNTVVFDFLDYASRNIYHALADDSRFVEDNREHNHGFLSSWDANSDEDEYRRLFRKLTLYKTSNLLFPQSLSEAEMGRFLTETAKF